jgi:hypothetical protein
MTAGVYHEAALRHRVVDHLIGRQARLAATGFAEPRVIKVGLLYLGLRYE